MYLQNTNSIKYIEKKGNKTLKTHPFLTILLLYLCGNAVTGVTLQHPLPAPRSGTLHFCLEIGHVGNIYTLEIGK